MLFIKLTLFAAICIAALSCSTCGVSAASWDDWFENYYLKQNDSDVALGWIDADHFINNNTQNAVETTTESSLSSYQTASAGRHCVCETIERFITIISSAKDAFSQIAGSLTNADGQKIVWLLEDAFDNAVLAAKNLQENVETVRDRLRANIENSINGIINWWEHWAFQAIEDARETLQGNARAIREVRQIVNDHKNTYIGYLNAVTEGITADFWKNFEPKVQNTIEEYQNIFGDMIREIQTCLPSWNSQCQENISNQIRRLRGSVCAFNGLQGECNEVNSSDLSQTEAIKSVIAAYDREQEEILEKIENIKQQGGGRRRVVVKKKKAPSSSSEQFT